MRIVACIALVFASVCSAFADGAEISAVVDVARKNTSLSLSFTECCDHTVRATVRDRGNDYALAGWEVNLVFGGASSGCIHEGIVTNFNEVVFHCEAASMPTNGKYTVQIMATKNRVSHEWARGTLRVSANPGMSYMPSCWMGYQRVAKLSASLIALNLITNEFWTAVMADLNSKVQVTIPASTNPCVRVQKSMVSEIPITTKFVWDGTNNVDMAFRNKDFEGAYFLIPSNRNMMAATFYLPGTNGLVETFNPERIGKYPWFRSTSVTNRKFMVRGGFCTDAKKNQILIVE